MNRPVLTFAVMAVALMASGCNVGQSKVVRVYLYPNGHLAADRITIDPDDYKRFAEELDGKPVKIIPIGADGRKVTFGQAADVSERLKLAGVKHVTIEMGDY